MDFMCASTPGPLPEAVVVEPVGNLIRTWTVKCEILKNQLNGAAKSMGLTKRCCKRFKMKHIIIQSFTYLSIKHRRLKTESEIVLVSKHAWPILYTCLTTDKMELKVRFNEFIY